MRIHLTPKKGGRRFAGAAVAVSALAMIAGADPGGVGAYRGPGRPGRRGRAQIKHLPLATDAGPVLGHGPSGSVFLIWDGNYNSPGSTGVAYKVTGQFPHSTTMSFTTYNNLVDINGPGYVLNDSDDHSGPRVGEPLRPGHQGGG